MWVTFSCLHVRARAYWYGNLAWPGCRVNGLLCRRARASVHLLVSHSAACSCVAFHPFARSRCKKELGTPECVCFIVRAYWPQCCWAYAPTSHTHHTHMQNAHRPVTKKTVFRVRPSHQYESTCSYNPFLLAIFHIAFVHLVTELSQKCPTVEALKSNPMAERS